MERRPCVVNGEKGGREADENKEGPGPRSASSIKEKPLCPFCSGTNAGTRVSPSRLRCNLSSRPFPSVRSLFPSHCSWSIPDTQSPAIEKITTAEILVFASTARFSRSNNYTLVQPTFSFPSLGVCSPSITVHRGTDLSFFHDFVAVERTNVVTMVYHELAQASGHAQHGIFPAFQNAN